ncbi:50S ribosomal protein L10 [Enterobacteriaceae endosymbiont of Donacia tomentosa]|uniref:50S ribosomal protein L10 n=1 Tax=Enterobacteriaceae endosymbiont of Donacia tomentosa TaxID=2675787 RepID=UPI001449891C|nr:50S ribosomal protein L10 [Enterobacteriaceae endosymbiont of Donacia tomentosa]QJC31750.1 50S ribosomal protein L10 [Enterobacteriaceae endosymbiont of Donacia tomentosa]
MPLNLTKKKMIVAKINKIDKCSLSAVIADFTGVNTNSLTLLRKKSQKNNVSVIIVRNRLLKLIMQNSNFQCLKSQLNGPILIGYSLKHPGAAARLFTEFAKINNNFKIKSAAFNKKLIDIDILASLPTYNEALSRFLHIIKEISVGKFVKILTAIKNIK